MEPHKKKDKNKLSTDEIKDIYSHLQVRGVKHIDRLGFGTNFMNYFISILIATYFGWSLSVLGNVLIFILVTYYIAPKLANFILKKRVKSFVMKNYEKMADVGKGKQQFYLYNHCYEVAWEHVDYGSSSRDE